jgi:hypothetical protein
MPSGGFILATFLYVLAAWLVFNAVFALGMYFRPKRPTMAKDGRPNAISSERSVTLSKVLFFGLWLNDRHHSA